MTVIDPLLPSEPRWQTSAEQRKRTSKQAPRRSDSPSPRTRLPPNFPCAPDNSDLAIQQLTRLWGVETESRISAFDLNCIARILLCLWMLPREKTSRVMVRVG